MRYNYAQRLQAVLDVIENKQSLCSVSSLLGVSREHLREWVHRYEKYGSSGLSIKEKGYTGEFKQSVLSDMYENQLSSFETAIKYGVSRWSIQCWDGIYRQCGSSGLYRNNRGKMKKPKKPKPSSGMNSQDDILKELEYLRAENAYLKKLQALVEERIVRESGRKPKPSKD